MFPERLESDRLRYTRLCRETVDVTELYRICSADDGIDSVTEHLPWEPHASVKATEDYVRESERSWRDRTAATYVVVPRASEDGHDELAGITSLTVDWDRSVGETGIWLRKHYWGRGYAGERAATFLELTFDALDLDLVEVHVQDGNANSRRVVAGYVDRFGGQYEGRLRNSAVQRGRPVDQHRYTISRDEFRAARRGVGR